MTLEEFLEELKQTPRDWFLWDSPHLSGIKQAIRRRGPNSLLQCPIASIRGVSGYIFNPRALGMSMVVVWAIMAAADNSERTPLREQLLEACGL